MDGMMPYSGSQDALSLVLGALAGQLLQDDTSLLAGQQVVHALVGVCQGLPHLTPLEALQLRQLRRLPSTCLGQDLCLHVRGFVCLGCREVLTAS